MKNVALTLVEPGRSLISSRRPHLLYALTTWAVHLSGIATDFLGRTPFDTNESQHERFKGLIRIDSRMFLYSIRLISPYFSYIGTKDSKTSVDQWLMVNSWIWKNAWYLSWLSHGMGNRAWVFPWWHPLAHDIVVRELPRTGGTGSRRSLRNRRNDGKPTGLSGEN